MITIKYESEPYYYENIQEGQAYGINTEIKINEDASLTDIIEAIARLTKFAGYSAKKSNFLDAIEDVFGDYEDR